MWRLKRLPDMARIVRGIFMSEDKHVVPRQRVLVKLYKVSVLCRPRRSLQPSNQCILMFLADPVAKPGAALQSPP